VLLRTAAGSAAGVIVLAVLGAVMGPSWNPRPVTDVPAVESTSTSITVPDPAADADADAAAAAAAAAATGAAPGASAAAGVVGGAAGVGTYEVESHVVDVELDGAVVQAQVLAPVGAGEDLDGLVFVHGAGTGEFTRAFRIQARDLASAGIVTMVPNKRLDTYTTVSRDYPAMAADYYRSVEVLRGWPGVDPDRVGVYGESEGCWIVPVMTAEQPQIAYSVLVSAPVVPPRQQAAFAADSYLRNTDVPQGVFRAIPRAVGLEFPGEMFDYADFDVTPYQRRTTQPVLMAYGTDDSSMPIVQGPVQMRADLAVAGNDALTVRYYADADHGIRVDGTVSADFVRDLADWVTGLPATGTAPPRVAGDQPHQTFRADPLPTPRWFGTVDGVLATVLTGAAAVLAGLLALLAVRLLRPRGWGLARGLTGPLLALAAGAVTTVVALVAYLVAVARLALDYERNAWVVQGGWLGVRLLGIVAVVAAAVLVLRVRDAHRDADVDVARGVIAWIGLGALSAGSVVLLVTLAYWGVYQLGI
jgi:dienelactone hydrolase